LVVALVGETTQGETIVKRTGVVLDGGGVLEQMSDEPLLHVVDHFHLGGGASYLIKNGILGDCESGLRSLYLLAGIKHHAITSTSYRREDRPTYRY
jgi:hypothetical protein